MDVFLPSKLPVGNIINTSPYSIYYIVLIITQSENLTNIYDIFNNKINLLTFFTFGFKKSNNS